MALSVYAGPKKRELAPRMVPAARVIPNVELLVSLRRGPPGITLCFWIAVWRLARWSCPIMSGHYLRLLQQIASGTLAHADETKGVVYGGGHYIWVFTNLTSVACVWRRLTRKGPPKHRGPTGCSRETGTSDSRERPHSCLNSSRRAANTYRFHWWIRGAG